jgi:CIC family chloride channel protein
MSGVLHAPLTAIFLIAEITSGYTLFVPLMLVSAISYTTFTYFEKHSFYTKHLIERGDLIQHDKDRQVLSLIPLRKLVETDLMNVSPEATLGRLVDLVRKSKRNIFPVVNDEKALVGIVTLDDIREIMFDEQLRDRLLVKELMHAPPENVSSHEKMQSVMSKFEQTGAWNLPVIDDGKYVGFVSKSRIFNAYRTKLRRQHPN